MIITNHFPCKNCPKKGCGAYHDVCEAYQAFRQKQATDKKQEIIALRKQGLSMQAIADKMHYAKSTVCKIINQ